MNLHITHINLARGFRGGERQTALLIQALDKLNLKQTLIVRHGSPLPEKMRLDQLNHVRCVQIKKPYWQAILSLGKTDVIHAHEAKACQLAFLIHLVKRVPYIITRRVPNQPRRNLFNQWIYRQASSIACLSQAIQHVICKTFPNASTLCIPSMYASLSINNDTIHQLKMRYKDKFIIGHTGALVNKHKGQRFIIEAARILSIKHPQIHFLLLGDGQDKADLEKQIKGFSNIELLGFKDNVGDYMSIFDVFLFPSLEEGLGSSILDAIYFKKPVVATNVGGIPDIVTHERTGLLIEPGNSEAIAEAIERLYLDPGYAEQLALQAEESLMTYAPENISNQYHSLYNQAVSNISA